LLLSYFWYDLFKRINNIHYVDKFPELSAAKEATDGRTSFTPCVAINDEAETCAPIEKCIKKIKCATQDFLEWAFSKEYLPKGL
jgi:hypothetical protein